MDSRWWQGEVEKIAVLFSHFRGARQVLHIKDTLGQKSLRDYTTSFRSVIVTQSALPFCCH